MSELVELTLTCHTAGCVNDGIGIVLLCPPDSAKVCGPCGQYIEDVV